MPGRADRIDRKTVFGWALQPDLKTPDSVQIYVGGMLVAILPCYMPRDDLAARGYGSGQGGFRFIFPSPIGETQATEIVVKALSTGETLGRAVLGGAQVDFLDGTGPFKSALWKRPYAVSVTALRRDSGGLHITVRTLSPPGATLGIVSCTTGIAVAKTRARFVDLPDIPEGGSIFHDIDIDTAPLPAAAPRTAIFELVDTSAAPNPNAAAPDEKLPGPAGRFCVPIDLTWAAPPAKSNMVRTSGKKSDADNWAWTGTDTALRIHDIINGFLATKNPHRLRILDWGVGGGRVAVPLKRLFYPDAEVFGVDVDRVNIEWGQANLPDIPVQLGEFFPPLKFADRTFDAIYGISVMTHLKRDAQLAWLRELRRILRPGGLCILSTHGEHALILRKNRAPKMLSELQAAGISDYFKDENLGPLLDIPDYYRATFQLRAQVEAVWAREMEVAAYLPTGNAAFQDLVVLRRPSDESQS